MAVEQMGHEAFNKILSHNFKEASLILSKAIKLYPEDSRLYSNRCYCYLELGDYESAQQDAAKLKESDACYWAGYYLLGECLMKSQRYSEAEAEYHKAYVLHPVEVVADRLFEAQMHQNLAKGYDPLLARRALLSTRVVQEALSSIELNSLPHVELVQGPAMKFSSDEEKHLTTELYGKTQTAAVPPPRPLLVSNVSASAACAKIDPSRDNPFKSKTLWVGNLPHAVEGEKLRNLFGEYSRVTRVYVKDFHAFIEYVDWTSAGKAREYLQGTRFNDYCRRLIISYPKRVTR